MTGTTTPNNILTESAVFPKYVVVTNGEMDGRRQNGRGTRPVPFTLYVTERRALVKILH